MSRFASRIALLTAAGVGLYALSRTIRRPCDFTFPGKVVLITGGSRGLGLLLARELAAEGAALALCARDADELARVETELALHATDVFTGTCDVTNAGEVESFVNRVLDRFGRIDVLINNAGIIQSGPMEAMTCDDYEEAIRTHLFGPIYFVNAVLPQMQERGAGRIVNIASIGGKISVPHLLPYSASKFALVGYSEGLRSELTKDGIVVTTVCPGLMRTGSPRNAWFKGQHRAEYAWFKLSDSLPLASMNAERAARQIVEACRRGDAEVVLSLPAKAAALFHGVFPGLTSDLLGLVNRMLPAPGGLGRQRARGYESESALSASPLTALTQAAEQRNNQIR